MRLLWSTCVALQIMATWGANINFEPEQISSTLLHRSSKDMQKYLNEKPIIMRELPRRTTRNVHQSQPEIIKKFHDIYMRYISPHHLTFGFVEMKPKFFEKRLETVKNGNRYKGQVIWYDGTGGYGAHSWDLAQGKLEGERDF